MPFYRYLLEETNLREVFIEAENEADAEKIFGQKVLSDWYDESEYLDETFELTLIDGPNEWED